VYHLGAKLVELLQVIHKAGYIYNDLKPDNILLGYNEQPPQWPELGNCFKDLTINLVDFGFATPFVS